MNHLETMTINEHEDLMSALTKIDNNKKGFLIVLDNDSTVVATLTDGDIRRGILKGCTLNSPIGESANKDFISLSCEDSFYDAIDKFKSSHINFIPVLGKDRTLHNIIPKAAVHALLLQDIKPEFDYDFINVDTSIIDYEIYQRPWGFYKTTILNDMFQSKIISVEPGASLSYQMHQKREEHWVIVHGIGEVRLDDSIISVRDGSYLFIPKGCKHRLTNTSADETLLLIEVQCGQYFGEDDIVRIEDDYGRE